MENTTQEFKKPIAKVVGRDGNVFVTLGICSQALKKAGYKDKADELVGKVMSAQSYGEALRIMSEYCQLK